MLSFVAKADDEASYSLTLNIDNPANVTLQGYDENWQAFNVDLVAGDNVLGEGAYNLETVEGALIASVEYDGVPAEDFSSSNYYTIYVDEYSDGAVLAVKTIANAEEARTAKAKIVCDDYTKVKIGYSGTYEEPELTSNDCEISFIPSVESTFTIRHKDYSGKLYEVKLNGEALANEYGAFYAYDVADGDVIEVTVAFPENPQPVSISFAEGAEGCISSVLVDNEAVDNYLSEDFTVNYGSSIKFKLDEVNFTGFSGTVNGEAISYLYSGWSTEITGETAFVFSATKKEVSTITLNIDNAAAVTAFLGGEYTGTKMDLVDGDNKVDISDGTSITFRANDGFIITDAQRIVDGESNAEYFNQNYCNVRYYSDYGACTYKITTGNLDELRTATAIVEVDDPSLVRLMTGANERPLVEGSNVLKFIPDQESTFTVYATSWTTPLYAVSHNDEEVEKSGTAFTIEGVQDGDKINIQANFPEGDAIIRFVFADEDSRALITSVTVDSEDVPDFAAEEGFTAPLGSSVVVRGTTGMVVDQLVFGTDDRTNSWYGSYTFAASKDMDILVKAHPYADATMTFNVVNAQPIKAFYRNENWENVDIELEEGANTVVLSENIGSIYVYLESASWKFTEITENGEELTPNYSGYYIVKILDGAVINLVAEEILRENQAMFYLGEGNYNFFNVENGERYNPINVTYGTYEAKYMPFTFDNDENPFAINGYAETGIWCYINGNLLESESEDYYCVDSYTFAPGDVLKVFAYAPSSATVTIDDPNAIANVTVDRITALAEASVSVLEGTEVKIEAIEGKEIGSVKVNGAAIEANADGAYIFNVAADTEAYEVVVDANSGISTVVTDAVENGEVYNLQGIKVNKKDLAPGVYIVNGKKISIR